MVHASRIGASEAVGDPSTGSCAFAKAYPRESFVAARIRCAWSVESTRRCSIRCIAHRDEPRRCLSTCRYACWRLWCPVPDNTAPWKSWAASSALRSCLSRRRPV